MKDIAISFHCILAGFPIKVERSC